MLTAVITLLFIFLAAMFLSITIGIFLAFHNRKCPYCGKRLHHQYNRYDKDGKIEAYVFHCPHCGASNTIYGEVGKCSYCKQTIEAKK